MDERKSRKSILSLRVQDATPNYDGSDGKHVQETKIRFDEDNIRSTIEPAGTVYCLVSRKEQETQFSICDESDEADRVRKHLLNTKAKIDDKVNVVNANNVGNIDNAAMEASSLNAEYPRAPQNAYGGDADEIEQRRKEFYRKRKLFVQSEYTIAQKLSMSLVISKSEETHAKPSLNNNYKIRTLIHRNRKSLHEMAKSLDVKEDME